MAGPLPYRTTPEVLEAFQGGASLMWVKDGIGHRVVKLEASVFRRNEFVVAHVEERLGPSWFRPDGTPEVESDGVLVPEGRLCHFQSRTRPLSSFEHFALKYPGALQLACWVMGFATGVIVGAVLARA